MASRLKVRRATQSTDPTRGSPARTAGLMKNFQPVGNAPSGERYVRTERKAEDYQAHTLHSHIYANPDTYIGSLEKDPRQELVYDTGTNRLTLANLDVSEGVIRCFLEILSNAGDNAFSSRQMGVAAGSIKVTMDRKWVTIRSEGEPIPVVPKEELCTPPTSENPKGQILSLIDFIFGQLLTSSNYDTRVIRMGCGKNGYGAKLCNIFSKYFRVRVGDPRRLVDPNDESKGYKGGHEHISVWEQNMTQHTQSQSTPGYVYSQGPDGTMRLFQAPALASAGMPGERNLTGFYTGPAYVEVSWLLDFERFDCRVSPDGEFGYPDEAIGLFARYLADFSLTCKVPTSFNNVEIDVRNIEDYGRLFFDEEECKSSVTHYEWGTTDNEPPEIVARVRGAARTRLLAQCPTVECVPQVEMCIFDTPDKSNVLSFVNGLMTMDGGVHVNEAYKLLSAEVLEKINSTARGSGKKKGKKGKKDTPEVKVPHLTAADVKPHVSMILVCRLPDPAYSSQSKRQLTRPKPKLTIPPAIITAMGKWSLIERLFAALDAKMFKTLTKSDGKKRRYVNLDKGEDANDAGGPRSHDCVLYLTEGLSASGYPKRRIALKGGKDLAGYYPLKGKAMNITDAPHHKVAENDEINAFKKLMGLCEGVDYSDPAALATLRYGMILSCMDMDGDGKHITSLWLNIIHRKWPSLLRLGKFAFLMTPLIRLYKKSKVVQRFYSLREYEKWIGQNPNHGCEVKYYKGLGTSSKEEVADDVDTAPVIICLYDPEAPSSLDLAFRKTMTDQRKEWMKKWRESTGVEDIQMVPIQGVYYERPVTSIINRDLVEYTIESLFRAIPSFKDGLKLCQRQVLMYILEKWKYGHSRAKSVKVAGIAAGTLEQMEYHHGPKSLMDAIINMAQDFTGSNNLNFFKQDGEFGTRDTGGADAADGRYSETQPEWWLKYAYLKELIDLIPRRYVEGKAVEPIWLPCIVPMHFVNGFAGVATGHSTFGPAHNMYEVIRWLLMKCQGRNPEPLTPWYRGFTGTITIVRPSDKTSDIDSVHEDTAELTAAFSDSAKLEVKAPPQSRLKVRRATDLPPLTVDVPTLDDVKKKSKKVTPTSHEDELPLPGDSEEESEDEDGSEDDIKEGVKALAHIADGRRIKGISMKTQGTFTITNTRADGKCNVLVTELPIGTWISKYRKWLESLRETKQIEGFRDNSTPEIPKFTITGFSHKKGVNHETLRLNRCYGLSNITLIDDDGYPYHFDDVQNALEAYYKSMIELFAQLIAKRVADIQANIVDCTLRLKFIMLVVDKAIRVLDQSKKETYAQMDTHEIPHKYLQSVKLYECTPEEIVACRKELETLAVKLEETKKQTPQQIWSEKLEAFYKALQTHGYK